MYGYLNIFNKLKEFLDRPKENLLFKESNLLIIRLQIKKKIYTKIIPQHYLIRTNFISRL
jgi:hypothetical protein